MKRLIVFTVVILIVGLIVFTLFTNRAAMRGKIGTNRIIGSYPVLVVPVSKQVVNEQFTREGLIVANNDVTVISSIQGPITKVLVKIGDFVESKAVLVQVFDGLGDIKAPISGIVTQLPVTEGMSLNSGTTVAEIVDISSLKVKLNIDEQDVFKLKVGDQAVVETDVYPGVKFGGKIQNISIKADEIHTYPIEVIIHNNQQYQLKSGMFGKVSFKLRSYSALIIPRDTLVGSVQTPQVFVVNNDKVRLRNIQVGKEIDGNIVVLQGLKEGESVVFSGQENLKDNDKVEVISDNFNQGSDNNLNFSFRQRDHSKAKKYKAK